MSELGRRIAFAVVAIPVGGAIVWLGGLPLALLLSLIAGLGAWEFFRLARAGGVHAFGGVGIAIAAAIPVIVHLNDAGVTAVPIAAGALAVLGVFAAAVWRRSGERPLSAVAATVFGVVYTGGMMPFAYELRVHRFAVGALAGTVLLGLPLLITWANDTGGYAFGKWFGRTKLIPSVSPGKTVAGSVGGLLLAVAVTGAYVAFVLRPYAHLALTTVGIAIVATVVSAAAQTGDLAESLLKREAGMKDSSHIIPGHGGVLDRFDSLLFVLPVAYVLLTELLVAVP